MTVLGRVHLSVLEKLFGTLSEDITATDIKNIKKDLEDLGQKVVTVEQTNNSKEKELDRHRRELREL
ncbi:hypothetical protein NDU88_009373 [Pleurodeles waltl]|uniref:Uncharacterized protein n=1 Tax=Pleurodeles waltl TaxID=8319 RepID=A0AAV7QRC4_PLEWA|nr:hypothetical protein NDU88_009373 [Pleurodeles waltl]